jgi:hypothetical protein
MLEASAQPVMVPGWWRRWPAWSTYAAMAWSMIYGALALSWEAGAPGFPFGEGDPEGAAMGSVLFAVPAEPTGLVMAGWCAAGVIVAGAMRRPTSHRRRRRVLLAVAWCFAVTMLLVIPDIRLLQNLAYGLLFVFVKLDGAVLNQGVIVLGGIFWIMTAISYRRKTAGTGTGRRESKVAANRLPVLMRWGKAATYAAFLLPLPYGITRLAWALGLPLGIDQDLSGDPLTARIGEAGLATLAIGGGTVTLGLIRPWGEIWPRWVPFLAGQRVPVALPTILGGVAALAITVGGLAFVRLAIIGALGLAPEPAEPPAYTGWATWAPGWLWPFWGIALAVATIAYYHRRHDQGRPAAGPRLGRGAPC